MLSVGAVVFGLLYLFLEPNSVEPLNQGKWFVGWIIADWIVEAGRILREDPTAFAQLVRHRIQHKD